MKSKKTAGGIGMVIGGLALGFFTFAHRPQEGFMEAMQQANSWVFAPTPYYILLFVSVLICLGGVWTLIRASSDK